jgi:hypothetical protein
MRLRQGRCREMQVFRAFSMVLVLIGVALTGAAYGQADPGVTLLERMFHETAIDPGMFATSFTESVPVKQVQGYVDDVRNRLGSLTSAKKDADEYQLAFAKGSLRATLILDSSGKVIGLRFHDEVSDADRAALERVLRADHVSSDWFTAAFMDEVSTATLDGILAKFRADEGAFTRVDVRGGAFYSVFAKGASRTQITTDANGKIVTLFFAPFVPS